MAFRNKQMTMPSIDDIIMQIMAMSEAFYNSEYTIGWSLYDQHRPPQWPTALYLLKYYGYLQSSAGWSDMVKEHISIECKTFTEAMRGNAEERMRKRWHLDGKPEYSAAPDERYLALMSVNGFAICKGTYERTGRMMLR